MGTLAGRVAVITGSTRGIGLAVAARLAAEGSAVVISSRKPEAVAAAVADLEASHPGRVAGAVAHAGRPEDIDAMVGEAMKHFGRVDIAVHSAGNSPHFGPVIDSTPEAWDVAFRVNVLGALALARASVRAWMGANGGAIVNVATIGGLQPRPNVGVYNTTKAALIMLTRQLAKELGPLGIRVNSVAPGLVKTDFSAAMWQDATRLEDVLSENPLGRLATADEVAAAVLFLVSDAASIVNGHTLVLDGGATGSR